MKKVIFLSILTVFSFLEASRPEAPEGPEGPNPWRRRATLSAGALSRPLLKDLNLSFGGETRGRSPFLLGSGDIPLKKHAWWVGGVPLNSLPNDVNDLFDRRGTKVSSLVVLEVSAAPANRVDRTRQNLSLALFGSKPVNVKVRRSKQERPYIIKTEERRKRIAAQKYLGDYKCASTSFPPSKRIGHPAPLSRKYNNQPKHKLTRRS